MSGPDDSRETGHRQWRRRTVLRSVAAGLGTAGTAGVASAQAGTATEADGQVGMRRAVILEQPNYDQTVTGFFVQFGAEIDPIESSVDDDCEYVSWGDDETLAYDARLIDRTADPETQQITVYLHASIAGDIEPGMLFIVNDRQQCESGYLGVELEHVGINLAQLRSRDFTPTEPEGAGGGDEDGGIGAGGPGLGVLSGLAGLCGAGWLAGRRGG